MSDDRSPAGEALYRSMRNLAEAMGEWLERMRPAFDTLLEVANRPEVREAITRAQSQPRPRPCYCFCPRLHPSDKGICDGEGVTTRLFTSKLTGPVDVSLCGPCDAARGHHKARVNRYLAGSLARFRTRASGRVAGGVRPARRGLPPTPQRRRRYGTRTCPPAGLSRVLAGKTRMRRRPATLTGQTSNRPFPGAATRVAPAARRATRCSQGRGG